MSGRRESLNQIMPSHRQVLRYIEHASLHSYDDSLSISIAEGAKQKEISLPFRNIAGLMLGPGTSITQKAAQKCREANICLMFTTGDGGTPLLWTAPDEYRPSSYSRAFHKLYYEDSQKALAIRLFVEFRIEAVMKNWPRYIDDQDSLDSCKKACELFKRQSQHLTGQSLLLEEARFTKTLYAIAARSFGVNWTSRQHQGDIDKANEYLNHGNYLAYGVANIALYVLGIPYSLNLIHGSTRAGALVFDVADLFKDACVLPMAFRAVANHDNEKIFRKNLINEFDQRKWLSQCLNTLKKACNYAEISLEE
jgi:CRISPR-associated protein Cas1